MNYAQYYRGGGQQFSAAQGPPQQYMAPGRPPLQPSIFPRDQLQKQRKRRRVSSGQSPDFGPNSLRSYVRPDIGDHGPRSHYGQEQLQTSTFPYMVLY